MTIRVLVHHPVREEMDRLAADCAGRPEAGGILLGAYRGRDVEVVGTTRPAPRDERRLFSFTRADPAHQLACDRAWSVSEGTVTYVGEWHTHPVAGVHPSSTDVRSWASEARRCERAMAFALVVPGDWGLFVIRSRLFRSSAVRLRTVETGRVGMVFAR